MGFPQVQAAPAFLAKQAGRYETKLQKKKKDDDSIVVQTMDLERWGLLQRGSLGNI